MLSRVLFLTLVLAGSAASGGELVDRIVAIVDRDVITLSEAEEEQRMTELATGLEPPSLVEAVETLVEARLIEREVDRFGGEPVPRELVDEARESLFASYPSEEAYREALRSRSLSDETLRELLRRQLAITRYLESRFRALTHVTDEEVERYYRDKLLPELPRGAEEPLAEHAETIRRLLEARKFNERVDAWISELKSRARIRRYVW